MEPTENWYIVKKTNKWFNSVMLGKMASNVHKGDWRKVTTEYLTNRLEEEIKEFKEAKKPASRVLELADVANVAMLLADKVMIEASNG